MSKVDTADVVVEPTAEIPHTFDHADSRQVELCSFVNLALLFCRGVHARFRMRQRRIIAVDQRGGAL